MAFKRRRKTTRFRGSHTHGRGFKKKARGSGHRGGFGMAGTGKRGDAKKTMILNLFGNDYFGKDKTLRRGTVEAKAPVINLAQVREQLDPLVKEGKAKESKGGYEINLEEYKILGALEGKEKLFIKAKSASEGAINSVKAAGGEITVKRPSSLAKKVPVKEDKKVIVKAK